MGYGKRFRNFARNTAAYTSGYILGGHAGGFAAYKGAEYLDNSLQKMRQTRSQSKRTPTFRSKKGISGGGKKRIKQVTKKRMGSTPKTLFKKKPRMYKKDPLDVSGHNDMAMHKFPIVIRKPKGKKVGVGRYLYQETWDGFSTTLEGKQILKICKYFATSQQLLGDTLTLDRTEKDSWAINPCALNPYQNITNPTAYPSYQTTNDSFYLKSIKAQLAVVSTCTIPQKVKVMWLMYKKNCNMNPQQLWDAAILYEGMGASAVTFPSNPTVQLTSAYTSTGQAPAEFIEQSPFQFKMFRQYFKLLHKEEFCLQPGDQRHFEADIQINKRFDIPYIRSMKNTSSDQFLGGITVVPVILHYGGLVQIQKSSTLDTTYGIADIGIMQNNTYNFQAVKADRLSANKTFVGHVSAVTADLDLISTTTTREFTVNVVDAAAANQNI